MNGYYKKMPDANTINRAYAASINAYLHLRGSGRQIQATAPKNNPDKLLITWGDSLLQHQVLVNTEKFTHWIKTTQPDIQTIKSTLNKKTQKTQ